MAKQVKEKQEKESTKLPICDKDHPVVFQSKSPYLRLVNPKNIPRHDKKTQEGIWGEVVVFDGHTYTCRSKAQLKWMFEHPSFRKDFWIKGEKPINAVRDRIVGVVTTPFPSDAISRTPPRG